MCRFPFGVGSCVMVDGTFLATGGDTQRSGLVLRKDGWVVLFSSHRVETTRSLVTYTSFLCFFVYILCPWQYRVQGHRAITLYWDRLERKV